MGKFLNFICLLIALITDMRVVNCIFEWVQVSYLAADSLFPEWKIWTQFLDETTEGLRLDGLSESHPIEVNGHGLNFSFSCSSIFHLKHIVFFFFPGGDKSCR